MVLSIVALQLGWKLARVQGLGFRGLGFRVQGLGLGLKATLSHGGLVFGGDESDPNSWGVGFGAAELNELATTP